MKIVFSGRLIDIKSEDGGQALVAQVGGGALEDEVVEGDLAQFERAHSLSDDDGLFVQLHSWADRSLHSWRNSKPKHTLMDRMRGNRIRVTIEILD